jgi:predicted permease
MTTLWQDIRYGLRMLARSPGFAVVVVVILAAGIGANTAVFSVVNAVMLRPLPYKDSDRVVQIWQSGLDRAETFRHRPNFFYLRQNNQVFESITGMRGQPVYVRNIESPQEIFAAAVTTDFLSFFGVKPILGRGFLCDDEKPEQSRVCVVGHRFWQEHLKSDPNVIGKSLDLTIWKQTPDYKLTLYTENCTIVGVMPRGFSFPYHRPVQLWRPILMTEGPVGEHEPPVIPLARLKKGVTLEQARADLEVLASHLRSSKSRIEAAPPVEINRLLDGLLSGQRKLPLLIFGAAAFVLLIACSNVANLFLARASIRRREMAMRLALGASRGRLIRQMLIEGLILSIAAGLIGIVLTSCTVKTLVALCPVDIPRLKETNVDLSVLGFALGVSILTGLLFAIAPAWRASDVSVGQTLKQGLGRCGTDRQWRRVHNGLVVSQLGLSMILLVGTALLIRTLMTLHTVDLGFRPENVLATSITLPLTKYANDSRYENFFRPLLQRLEALPDVRSTAAVFDNGGGASAFDFSGNWDVDFTIAGQPDSGQKRSFRLVCVSPGFFDTMGIKLLRGETLSDRDPKGIVIDEALANKCFSDVDPIGQTLVSADKYRPGENLGAIVGVVKTVTSLDMPGSVGGVAYRQNQGDGLEAWTLVLVRTDGDPMRLAPMIRNVVTELEGGQAITEMEPLEATLARVLAPRRFVMILLGLFAGMALALATIGIYGLLQYGTARQQRDIGIRMALGATRANVLNAVLKQGLILIGIGVAFGLAGALAATRTLSSLLYDVTPTDPLTLVSVSVVLSAITLLASYLPARRAAKVDPMVALRCE